jgi:glycerol-3-phosphate dehydrogenase
LLRAAPHIIWPLRFVLPHHAGLRPAWFLRLGLFLYDHLGGRKVLPATCTVDLRQAPFSGILQPHYTRGFEYSDCWVEDARLVVLNAQDAAERGATAFTRTALSAAERAADHWRLTLTRASGQVHHATARALVNAAGPWVADVARAAGARTANRTPRLVKGSHIVVRKRYTAPHCYTCQHADGRVVFMIPYEHDYTLIGTTDIPFHDDPSEVTASEDEIAYLCALASDYLAAPVTPADVVWTYAGVRPLYDDGEDNASAVTRDYVFDLDADAGAPPLLSIYGGKITTYRKLAEHALRDLAPLLDAPTRSWTATATLPGGDIPDADFEAYLADSMKALPWAPPNVLRRWLRAYGTRTMRFAGSAQSLAGLGADLGGGVTEAELDYLKSAEWATSGDDVLWRRSKLGLHLDAATQDRIRAWFGS